MTWYGSTNWAPDSALLVPGGAISDAVGAGAAGQLLIAWVSAEVSPFPDVTPAHHCAAVGSVASGVFTPSAQLLLDTGLTSEHARYGGIGNIIVGPSDVLISSWSGLLGASLDVRFSITRASFNLSSRVTRSITLNDGWADPFARFTALLIGGHVFTVQLSGTTNIIVTRLSDTDLSDVGSPTTFDISPSSRYSLGPYGVASGDYGVIDNIVLRQSGGAVVDVWDRGSITAIGPGIPGEPGSFFLSNASFRTGNSRVSFSGRTETSLGALPDAEGSGDVFDIDQATSGKLWTFTVGPGSS